MKKLLITAVLLVFMVLNGAAQTASEIVSERTMFTKMHMTTEGTYQQTISGGPIHYLKNGEWLDIDLAITPTKTGFENASNVIKSTFPAAIKPGSVVSMNIDGDIISMQGQKELVRYDALNGVQSLGVNPMVSTGNVSGAIIEYPAVFPQINERYEVSNGMVKNELELTDVPAEVAGMTTGYFGYTERISMPAGWTLEAYAAPVEGLITSGLKIMNAANEVVASIPAPIFFEAYDPSTDGASSVQGGFAIDMQAGEWLLTTLIPNEWLTASGRAFPVIMDPTVVLAGADGGWQSQNNYVNNPGYVFIGVCCGNLEHRAWVKFNTSVIPDNSCIDNVELQVYVNGVGATVAELVHAYDVTGAFGPYSGVIPAVYTDFGNGYYTSFTLSGTGYYGYYDLGPNADALMQSQLPGDWFQVAMIFDNEPSTNWKRLTAGLCNLRVDYSVPPCTLLPVGLVDFEAYCENDKALLTWSTVTESNSDFFTVWESKDGEEFYEVGTIQSVGNSTTQQDYRWTSNNTSNELAYYRLSQTDLDGTTEYFDTRVYMGCTNAEPILFQDANKKIHVTGRQITYVEIKDNMGNTIASDQNRGDMNEQVLTVDNLATGMYTATIMYDFGKKTTQQFMITK